jgi:hypothetical protein
LALASLAGGDRSVGLDPHGLLRQGLLLLLLVFTNTSVSVADRPAMKQSFMATLYSFPPSMTYRENWLYKTSYNSCTVKDKQMKLDV